MTKTVSIHDIARRTGVSRGTVSRAFNERADINPQTKAHILAVAQELNYRPNATARRLVRGRTDCIGLLVPDLSNPFLAELVTALEKQVRHQGLTAILALTHDQADLQDDALARMAAGLVDGLIVIPSETAHSVAALNQLNSRFPLVVTKELDGLLCDTVMGDDALAIRQLVDHLAALGHKRIAWVAPVAPEWSVHERLRVFEDARRACRLKPVPGIWLRAGTGQSVNEIKTALAARFAATAAPPPTALVAYDDIIALHLVRTLRDMGVQIPGQLSVTGFDNITFAAMGEVPLTTVAFDVDEQARLALELLLQRLADRHEAPPTHRRISPTLCVRQSTGPALG